MINTFIPKSIRPIIDEFIYSNFRPYTYKDLAKRLGLETNTLVQRVNRNPDYFDIKGDKPRIITLRKNIEEIYFYRDKNTCRVCQKKKKKEDLTIRFRDPYLKGKEKDNWNNVISSCQKCKDIILIKKFSRTEIPKSLTLGINAWEYKKIRIREVRKKINPHMKLYYPALEDNEMKIEQYYEFDELRGQGWVHVIDDNNERCKQLTDILNYFGSHGWELVKFKEYMERFGEFEQPTGDYLCLFKRKRMDDISND
jgi:hypothetical protein